MKCLWTSNWALLWWRRMVGASDANGGPVFYGNANQASGVWLTCLPGDDNIDQHSASSLVTHGDRLTSPKAHWPQVRNWNPNGDQPVILLVWFPNWTTQSEQADGGITCRTSKWWHPRGLVVETGDSGAGMTREPAGDLQLVIPPDVCRCRVHLRNFCQLYLTLLRLRRLTRVLMPYALAGRTCLCDWTGIEPLPRTGWTAPDDGYAPSV